MLVISRKTNESVLLTLNGVEMEVIIISADKNRVRLGLQAPAECKILRKELVHGKTNDSTGNAGRTG
jgi:carbon storage regulator